MGIDPTDISDMIIVGAYHLETGIRDFKDWSDLMIKQHGDKIKPIIDEIWQKSHKYLKEELMNQTRDRLEMESYERKTKERKFFTTAEKAPVTSPQLKQKLKEILPEEKEYLIEPNPEMLAKAEKRITENIEEAEKWAMTDILTDSAEKSATVVTLLDRYQKLGMFDKAAELLNEYATKLTQAGKFIQAASIYTRFTPEGFLRDIERQIEKINNDKRILDIFFGKKKVALTPEERAYILEEKRRIDAMPDGVEKVNANMALLDSIAKKIPPTISELIDAFRYQNMLSGWQSHERNIYWNMFNTLITRPAVLGAKGGIDYIESVLFEKERESYIKDVPLYYKHVLNAVPNAIDAFKAAWYMTDPTTLKPELGIQYKTPFEVARARQIPKYLTVVQRFMEASDKFNMTLLTSGETAINLKNGMTLEQATAEARAVAEMYLARNKYKLDELSALAKIPAVFSNIMLETRKFPVVGELSSYVVPFIRTPMNIGTFMIELSPLGLLRTKGFTPEVKARIAIGSLVTALGAIYAMQGKTTWVAPSDPKQKELFYATGKKPLQVEIADGKWVSVWYLAPFALAFMIPTAIRYYTTEQKKALTKNQIEKIGDIAAGIARFIGSQTSAQSIGAFFNFLSGDIDYTLPGQLGFTAEQVIPLSGLLRTTNKLLDPVYRHPEGFWEAIKKDMPFLSQDIPAYQTPEGKEAKRDWWNALLPYDVTKEDEIYSSIYDSINRMKQIQALTDELNKKVERGGKLTEKDLDNYLEKMRDAFSQD